MACNVINSWTFNGLVGAFLDLSIAYLLLCGSTLSYLASKFLGLFGLSLPCPCSGLFGSTDKSNCLQAILVNKPSLKISSVQSSVKKKLPFDSIWNNFYDDEDEDEEQHDSQSNVDKWQNRNVEMEGEASSCSWNEKKNFVGVKKGSFTPFPKWKGFGSQRPRVGLRRRKRAASGRRGKVLSFSYDSLVSMTTPTGLNSSASIGKFGNDITEGGTTSANSEDGWETSKEIEMPEQGSQGFEMDDDPFAENTLIEKEVALAEFKCLPPDQDFDGSDRNAIRVLEQALEEEHAARTALYLELEKERSAAATAADEAMAMILRLQEEKATIEMEARQYQRMIEEKSAYDAEEMNILKEILLRREREKHFLEKEVESYKQMFFENEQLDAEMYDTAATQEQKSSSIYSNEEPVLKLQQNTESVGEKEKTKINGDFSEYEIKSIRSLNHTLAFGKEIPIPELNEDAGSLNSSVEINRAHLSRIHDEVNQEFQNKGMALKNKSLNHQERRVQSSQSTEGPDLHEKAINPVVEEEEQCGETSPHQRLMPKTTEALEEAKIIFPYNNEKVEKHGEDLHGSYSGIDHHVHDVHVIYDECNVNNVENGNESEKKSISVTSNLPGTCDNPTIGGLVIEPDRKRNSLDRSGRLPPIGPSRGKHLPPILRRNSMSAFDYERLKIDNEVGWLRERLKIVQQGRDKLNFPVGHREREQAQLQILENIASQLREIRQLTEPGKALRQASLPPPSSKVMSKKRRWRGAPLGVLRSI
ncbi:GTD-binding domain - like 6 [Theobroma cacao]|nr:GTD-binding domain - like 6 [Theobroma cacao]